MISREFEAWLRRKRRTGILSESAYAVLAIGAGAVFLALTFWLVFMAAKLVLLSVLSLSPWVTPLSLLIALIVCALLFIDSLYHTRDDMSFLPLWILREYIDIGPRLMLDGYPHLRKARGWWAWDLETCGSVLMFLASRDTPVRKGDLLRIFPQVDWEVLKRQLKLLPGVIFFQPDEVRVTVTLPLRVALRQFRGRQRVHVAGGEPPPRVEPEPEPEPQPSAPVDPKRLSPAEILGVSQAAGAVEIRNAYRARIKECHPDRFAGMDEETQAQAEEWTKALNSAYESLMAQARRGGVK